MKRIAVVLGLVLAITACGDDDTTVTPTTQPSASTTASATATSVAPATTATTGTTSPLEAAPRDCLEIWPESLVQDVTGTQFAFLAANDDRSACTYFAAVSGIALGWRSDDATGFEQGRTGAGAVGTITEFSGVCDAAFYAGTDGVTFIMEAYSAAQGRVYTATLTGIPLEQAVAWAGGLLNASC